MKPAAPSDGPRRFRRQLQLTIMFVVVLVSALVLLIMQEQRSADAEEARQREFERTFDALTNIQALRHAMLLERGRELGHKISLQGGPGPLAQPHFYEATRTILADIMERDEESEPDHLGDGFHLEFYRFLNDAGEVIAPESTVWAGRLLPGETAQLVLPGQRLDRPQLGYMRREQVDVDGPIYDLIAIPVRWEGEPRILTTLVLGFEPASRLLQRMEPDAVRGLWLRGELYLSALKPAEARPVAAAVGAALARGAEAAKPIPFMLGGEPHLIFFQRLNLDSTYAAAYQVCLYPLTDLKATLVRLRWQVVGGGGLLLLTGLLASHVLAARFSRPVERLIRNLAEQRAERMRAEVEFAQAAEGMRRAARFSADASHQLRTPVTVLRAGLEEIRVRENLAPALAGEIGALVHQTYRLSGLIEDLLLLSRLDAGRLTLNFAPVDLAQLLESALDDWSVQRDQFSPVLEKDFPRSIPISGEKRYVALILQNLLENAHKYNRLHGRIRVTAGIEGEWVRLVVGNTTLRPIPPTVQEQIFDRFHRGGIAEDIHGYGLGLNLARELARLHGGELSLLRSDEQLTEFEVRFRSAGTEQTAS